MEPTSIKLEQLLVDLKPLTNYSPENVILISEIRYGLFNFLTNFSITGDNEWQIILDDLSNDVNRHLRQIIEASLESEKIESYNLAFEYLRQDIKDSLAKIDRL